MCRRRRAAPHQATPITSLVATSLSETIINYSSYPKHHAALMMSLAPGTRHDLTTQHVGLAASPFGRLPTEILALIASQLDDDNYLRLSYVSRAVWQLAHDPTLLRRRGASPAACRMPSAPAVLPP